MGQPQTQRLPPDERRALLLAAAEETFAQRGYTQAGLAEVANLAGVSKTLLYHYFPQGRPELYRHVMDRLGDQVIAVVRPAVRTSGPTRKRLADLVVVLLAHFEANPHAYRLLFLEPWGAGDEALVGHAVAFRVRLAGELNDLLASSGQAFPTTLAGGSAALGALLHVCELRMSGQVTPDQADDVAQRFVTGGLAALDLI